MQPFIESNATTCILAQLDLLALEQEVKRLRKQSDKLILVNLDSIAGLAQDRGGVDYLARTGVDGVVTTRGSLISRALHAEMLAVQKLFVTDRSNLSRAVSAVQGAKPDLLQVMPSPVLPFVEDHPLMKLRPIIAGGFITGAEDIERALAHGAIGVSLSSQELWNYER